MWTDENLKDAMNVLLGAQCVQKVVTPESTYVVADEVPYTDQLYLAALDELERGRQLKSIDRTSERETFQSSERETSESDERETSESDEQVNIDHNYEIGEA
jgi:hypothetical protein